MARTIRKQITTYVLPEMKQQIHELLMSSDHNRETESSLVERLLKEALGNRPRPRHGEPTRRKPVGA